MNENVLLIDYTKITDYFFEIFKYNLEKILNFKLEYVDKQHFIFFNKNGNKGTLIFLFQTNKKEIEKYDKFGNLNKVIYTNSDEDMHSKNKYAKIGLTVKEFTYEQYLSIERFKSGHIKYLNKNTYKISNSFGTLIKSHKEFKYKYKAIKDKNLNDIVQNHFLSGSLTFTNPKHLNDPFECDSTIFDYDLMTKTIYKEIYKYANINPKSLKEKIFSILYKNPTLLRDNKNNYYLEDKVINDLMLLFSVNVSKDKAEEIREDLDTKITLTLNHYFNLKDHIGVLSLSDTYNDILMWSYYGKEHTGICTRYNFETLLDDFQQSIELKGMVVGGYVNYKSAKPRFKHIFDKNNVCYIDMLIYIIDLSFTKFKNWSHEKEYRFIYLPYDNEEIEYKEVLTSIDKVYLGCRASDKDCSFIRSEFLNKGVTVSKLKMDKSKYKIS